MLLNMQKMELIVVYLLSLMHTSSARQGREPDNAEDRKVDRFIGEFRRYDIEVGGLQETKWFGSNVYRVGGSVVLTSGRKIPIGAVVKQRGESVALILSGLQYLSNL